MTALQRVALLIALAASVLPTDAGAGVLPGSPTIYQKPSSAWAVEARMHLDRRRWEEAAAALTRALHEEPDNVRIAVQLADVYHRLREHKRSIEILSEFVSRSTREYNIHYRLGLESEVLLDYRHALGYYHKALEIDPYLLPAYVRIAQVRVKQGFPYDAAKALRRCLAIDPGYTPALEELRVVNRIVKSDLANVYRRGNLVVLFDHHGLVTEIERLYPRLEAHRQYLEDSLGYHIPDVWVRVLPKIERHKGPPALYDELEDVILLSEEAVHHQDDKVFAHELAYLYIHRLTQKNAPRWMVEGLALWVSHPPFLDRTPLRTTDLSLDDLSRRFSDEKTHLRFEASPLPVKLAMVKAYAFVRFLHESYGLAGIRQILDAFRSGTTSFSKVALEVLHIPHDQLILRWNVYALTRFYFESTTRPNL